jgi:hypothetical protein
MIFVIQNFPSIFWANILGEEKKNKASTISFFAPKKVQLF